MSARRDLLGWLEALWPLVVPPALGALIATRWVSVPREGRPPPSRGGLAFAWFCSMALGIFFGPALGEHFALGDRQRMAAGFGVALIGLELIALVMAALRQWTADPVGTFTRWRDALLGRSGQ